VNVPSRLRAVPLSPACRLFPLSRLRLFPLARSRLFPLSRLRERVGVRGERSAALVFRKRRLGTLPLTRRAARVDLSRKRER